MVNRRRLNFCVRQAIISEEARWMLKMGKWKRNRPMVSTRRFSNRWRFFFQARGFSLVTLPRTVRQRTSEGTDSVGGSLKDQAQWSTPSSAPVPHLDKLHRIFRKLDLVKSWTHTKDGAVAACSSP